MYKWKEGIGEEVRNTAGPDVWKECHGSNGMGLFFIIPELQGQVWHKHKEVSNNLALLMNDSIAPAWYPNPGDSEREEVSFSVSLSLLAGNL